MKVAVDTGTPNGEIIRSVIGSEGTTVSLVEFALNNELIWLCSGNSACRWQKTWDAAKDDEAPEIIKQQTISEWDEHVDEQH